MGRFVGVLSIQIEVLFHQLPLPRVGHGWVRNSSFTFPQASNCLDLSHIYFTDIGDIDWAHLGPFYAIFDPLSGGSKHKNRDCACKLRAIALPLWAVIILTICKLFVRPLLCFVIFCLPERSGDIFTPIWLLHMVRWFSLLRTLLTHFRHSF